MDFNYHYERYKVNFEDLKIIGMGYEVSKEIAQVLFIRYVNNILTLQEKNEEIVVRVQALNAAYNAVFEK
jgi:hypothetical protein